MIEPQRSLGTSEALRPETILTKAIRDSCIKRLKLFKPAKKSEENPNKAAVLVPLCTHNGQLGLLYTLRSTKVSSNRGQVSFPGGMKDVSDKSFEETALRETWEELRIPKDLVDVWGSANLVGRKHVSVMPVLGYIGEIDPKSLQINTDEVEEAFVHSLESLCDPELCRFTQFRNNYTLPTYIGGKHRIWGLTAAITHMVMCSLVPDVYKHKLTFLQSVEDGSKNAMIVGNAQTS